MFWFIFLVCGVAFASDYKLDDERSLQWPEMYTFQGLKINLKADLAQEFQFWKDANTSRIDYNDGATKTFRYAGGEYGYEYRIHPKTTEKETNKMVCIYVAGSEDEDKTPESILPDVDEFEPIGTEIIRNEEVTKFYKNNLGEETHSRENLWAFYDNVTLVWIPLRYEEQTFNIWYGNLKDYHIWIFENFEQDFNTDALDFENYFPDSENCYSDEDDTEKQTVEKSSFFLHPDEDEKVFDLYKKRFQRQYKRHEKEHLIKKNIFKKNMDLVFSTNRQNLGYKLALNKLADHTPSEMKRRMGLKRSSTHEKGTISFPYTLTQIKEQSKDLPKEYDLRLMGWVTPVKEQVDCGCCWSMGSTAAVEGALARSNGGRLLSLSNQALIDCSWGYGESGCDGGFDRKAYKWMIKHGLPTVEEYGAYADTEGYCKIKNMTTLYRIRGYTDVTPYSIESLKWAVVNHGPLSVSVYVNKAFQLYSSGIFYDPLCNSTVSNHVVSLVGYGNRDGEDFWILKNSWGPDWGIDGYMHISMRDNNCGVATEPIYVVF